MEPQSPHLSLTPSVRPLIIPRWSHMRKHSVLNRPDAREVAASLSQAERIVRPAADLVGVMIVLPIVLPEADRAKVIAAALRESHKPAAGTRVWPTVTRPGDVLE